MDNKKNILMSKYPISKGEKKLYSFFILYMSKYIFKIIILLNVIKQNGHTSCMINSRGTNCTFCNFIF